MNALGYTRTSTFKQEQSIIAQKKQIKEYCDYKNWNLLKVYEDEGWSGAKTERPSFQRLLQRIDEEKIDVIVFTKLDRLGRSLQDLLNLAEQFKSKGIGFVSILDNIDTNSAQGRLAFQIMGAFAEFERNIIRERLEAGIVRARKQGVKWGRPTKNFKKEDVVDLLKKGVSVRWMAKNYKCSPVTIYKKLKEWNVQIKREVVLDA